MNSELAKDDDLVHDYEMTLADRKDGQIIIGDDVIAHIVDRAIQETEGVKLDSKFALSDYLPSRERRKEHVKGISVERDDATGSISITVSVRMAYGQDMYQVGVDLREHVRGAIQKMSRLIVSRVDIRIVGLIAERDKNPAAEPPAEPES